MLQQNNTDKIVVDKFICLINNSVNNKTKALDRRGKVARPMFFNNCFLVSGATQLRLLTSVIVQA